MKFLINQNDQFTQSYSRDDIQNLIDEKKIGINTEIWTEEWGQWKQLKDTDFNLQNAIYIENLKPSIEEEAGIGWQILAFFVPIAGIIMHFNNRKESPTKAKRYIQVTYFGIAFSLLIRLLSRL
jgi:hypothetical protein